MMKYFAGFAAAMALMSAPEAAEALTIRDHLRIKAGVAGVLPDESAFVETLGGGVEISDEIVPTVQLEWMFNDRISAELLCCVATHSVEAEPAGGGAINLGEVTLFPPTVTLKYRWNPHGAIQPYVGAGINYTLFFNEDTPASGPVTDIHYDESLGGALQAGVDIRTSEHWFVNFDVRKIWINTDVTIQAGGAIHADVDINPYVVTAAIGYRF